MTLAESLFALGHFDEARRWLAQAIWLTARQGVYDAHPAATAMQSLIDLTQGSLATARVRLECFSGDVAQPGTEHQPVRALVLYESGSLDQAQRLLGHSIADDNSPDTLIVTHILLARIAWSQGEISTCHRHLAMLEQSGRDRACRRIQCSVWIERARIAALQGRVEEAARALTQVERYGDWEHVDAHYLTNDVDTPSVARVRLLIAQRRFGEATLSLHPAIEQAHQRGRLRRKLKLRLLLAMALDGMGQHAAAIAELTGVLPFASQEGWRSTFVEEGACLATLLQRWAQTQGCESAITRGFIGDLLKCFAVGGGVSTEDSVADLTAREHQVVRLVAQGCQASAIAVGLQLSGHTVRAHLRNIYRKLGAHGQVEAAAIARARGLLDGPHEGSQDHSRQYPRRPGPHHRLGAPGHAQFGVDVLDVRLDRVGRDVQTLADLPV